MPCCLLMRSSTASWSHFWRVCFAISCVETSRFLYWCSQTERKCFLTTPMQNSGWENLLLHWRDTDRTLMRSSRSRWSAITKRSSRGNSPQMSLFNAIELSWSLRCRISVLVSAKTRLFNLRERQPCRNVKYRKTPGSPISEISRSWIVWPMKKRLRNGRTNHWLGCSEKPPSGSSHMLTPCGCQKGETQKR